MAKEMSTAAIFVRNLKLLMEFHKNMSSQNQLALISKVPQSTIGRVLRGEQIPTLEMIERLSQPFDLFPWQMLVPNFDPKDPPVTKQIDDQQREVLERFKFVAQQVAPYKLDPKK